MTLENALLASGIGKYHTNNPLAKQPKELLAIGWGEIKALVDAPQHVDKSASQWLITSTLLTRDVKAQEQAGEYWLLWADLDDKGTPSLHELDQFTVSTLFKDCNYELYTSRSATKELQKSRILIPLAQPLNASDWRICQQVFNNKLEENSVIPDQANESPNQILYLPNKAKAGFYLSISEREKGYFNPLESWANEIEVIKFEVAKQADALALKQRQARGKRDNLELNPNLASGNEAQFKELVRLFNQAYTPMDIMTGYGYAQRGNTFRHPDSQTGNYSASVIVDANGVLRVNTMSSADPLFTAGGGAHDAFSVFTVLNHNGNRADAVKDAGDSLLAIGGVSFNKAYQQKYMANKADTALVDGFSVEVNTNPDRIPFNLNKFTLRGKSTQMKLKMLEDAYVLDRIAILGQITVIYAKPNTGKTLLTLWMLDEQIKAKKIDGERVYYVNADDDYKGLVQKAEMAEEHGFHMLAPNHEGLKSDELVGHLEQMIVDDTAREAVIILDTLKKFTDLMDKKRASSFMTKAREFVSNGGTIILLAHTNKNRDADGKAIFGGTSDVVDDCDCVFILDEIAREGNYKRVFFENIKSRGDVANELAFKYSIEDGKHYQYRFDSVEMADQIITVQAKVDKEYWDGRDKNRLAIDAITEAIELEVNLKTELIKVAHENSGISKATLLKVLDRYKGACVRFDTKDLWREVTGVKNAKSYVLGSAPEATKEDYTRYKNGE